MSEAILPCRELLEQRTAELQASEERLRTIIRKNADAMLIVDDKGEVSFTNPAAEALFGRAESELIANGIGFPVVDGEPCEVQIQRPDGRTRTAEMRAVLITWDDKPAHLASLRDVTDKKNLEEQLRQAQKLEALGLLSAGIAHDFNNLTTVIIGSGQMILDDPGAAVLCSELAGEIMTAAQRASNLTRQLLAFARRQILRPKVLEMNTLVSDLAKMLGRLVGEHIRMEVIPSREKCFVNADPGQIEQVLMNLVVNSRDALAKGGTISIAISPVELAGDRFGPAFPPGPYVRLAVADDGHGMDESTMSHIFEPFFTTKGRANGTGLGLSTVYGIVKQRGGEIEVSSAPGNGTTFRIYFPKVTGMDERRERKSAEGPNGGAKTVLVVEDEPGLRKLTRTMLQKLGYTVLEAGGSAEALKTAEDHSGDIHLLLTDVVMPEMGGGELAQRLSSPRPRMRTLYMSGYIDDLVLEHGVSSSEVAFLQKPFSREQLAAKVGMVLDGHK